MSDRNDTILTIEEAAALLRVPVNDLIVELEERRIPGLKIGSYWRVSRDVLRVLIGEASSTFAAVASSPKADSRELVALREPSEYRERTGTHDENKEDSAIEQAADNQTVESEETVSSDEGTVDSNRTDDVALSLVPSQAGSLRGRVHVFNVVDKNGYLRLPDNRIVWLRHDSVREGELSLFPGDLIEFELSERGGRLEARNAGLVRNQHTKRPASADIRSERRHGDVPHAKRLNRLDGDNGLGVLVSRSAAQSASSEGSAASQRYYVEAAKARVEGRLDDARRFFWKAIEADAGIQTYEAFIGMEAGTRGAGGEARRIAKAAINKFPDHANFYVRLGQLERRNRRFADAEEVFRQGMSRFPQHTSLQWGLAQTLVQVGTEESLRSAGEIFEQLSKRGKLNRDDGLYQRYVALQRNPRANQAYDFFQAANLKVAIAGHRGLATYVTDILVQINDPEFDESFGMSGHFLVRCFRRPPSQMDVLDLSNFLAGLGTDAVIGVQDGRSVVVNPSIAFMAVADSDSVRDQVMSILSDRSEAIVPLDDILFANRDDPITGLRNLLLQYLGARDLYSNAMPVAGRRRFFGRERLLLQLTDQVHMGQFLGVYGLRKMGKTSLIYQLRDEKLSKQGVAYVDLQGSIAVTVKTCDPLYWELEQALHKRLKDHAPELASLLTMGSVSRYDEVLEMSSPPSVVFLEDMRNILNRIVDGKGGVVSHIVIVLDELERMLPVSNHPGLEGYLEFFGLLRGLAQTERYLGLVSVVVIAANASVSERGYWEGRENPVFALFRSQFLPPFSKAETEEMIRTLGRGMSIYWEDDAIDKVYSETGGHPFLTRSLCSRIATQNRNIRPLNVTRELVEEEITPFIRSEGDKLAQITELLHVNFPKEETLLESIALEETPSDLSDEAVRHLTGYHLIEVCNGEYKVSIELLARWLRRRAGVK